MSMLTLRLDAELEAQLTSLAALTGTSKSELARQALQAHLFKLQWEAAATPLAPHFLAAGVYSDDDVMKLCDAYRQERREINLSHSSKS
ncbi:MAG: ribbon-helix-helix protein, CopG family [Burkholderiales bacterium]|nr:ribbon-helix-helix protein, CopG family [Burkholderiales bacterium]